MGGVLYLDRTDFVITPQLLNESYESYETSVLAGILKEGDVVVDAGANIGYYTFIFSKIVGVTGKVFAFEPNPESFKILEKNIKKNHLENVFLFNMALGDYNGAAKLYLNDYNKGDNRLYSSDGKQSCVTIGCTTLDTAIPTNERVDFIKMDTQGSEVLILKGAIRILGNSRPKMALEYWPLGLKRAGTSAREFFELLDSYKYEYKMIDEELENCVKIMPKDLEKIGRASCRERVYVLV